MPSAAWYRYGERMAERPRLRMWLTGNDGQQHAPNSSGMETGGVIIQALAGQRATRM